MMDISRQERKDEKKAASLPQLWQILRPERSRLQFLNRRTGQDFVAKVRRSSSVCLFIRESAPWQDQMLGSEGRSKCLP